MPKEKNYNPVQAQRKADKAREVKKGKAEAKGRRDEKLARKNPERIQKQIDDLKAVTEKGGKLSKHEEQVLDGLEKEIKAVRRARDALGDKAPSWGAGRPDYSAGHKRRRGGGGGAGSGSGSDSEADVPEDVRRIPMPRDTPPPIPKAELDRWFAKRRARRDAARQNRADGNDNDNKDGNKDSNRDSNKDGDGRNKRARVEDKVESRTVYEAKPVVRDLRKEAVAAFVPTAVQMKMSKGKGQGGLLEPEEADRLEREGYMRTGGETLGSRDAAGDDASGAGPPSKQATVEDADED
ncbi:Protein saf1 [Escovopsis weberi]|uniref:Protein saf1 n=1 Tax=Escovopsis weberi TaxID=150374 RepID=A0A0M8MS00_ESCWE|nr:Protein saf1 [Escovopsis weberi]